MQHAADCRAGVQVAETVPRPPSISCRNESKTKPVYLSHFCFWISRGHWCRLFPPPPARAYFFIAHSVHSALPLLVDFLWSCKVTRPRAFGDRSRLRRKPCTIVPVCTDMIHCFLKCSKTTKKIPFYRPAISGVFSFFVPAHFCCYCFVVATKYYFLSVSLRIMSRH